ncbi:SRPBCC domain-containing protein [Agrococcus sp. ARC_14]|uniref:SRPBCC family protein n=1 Tax=Agrococcus sp. ARC_14 TaxID=2919927 RepID=UPI001F05D9F6|nr:SRPBCC domain-containing protein [Agrococcus sp. ARC_14]MCH1881873.1 SRPBCC domain-containing protein [Agrococcus sp. ARC_14]
METKQFTITRTFDAPREAVWRAWTDPAIAAQWWHPHEVVTKDGTVAIDLREGGSYAYTMVIPDGTEYPTGGEYLEVREPERLRFTWTDPGDDERESPIITIDLAELPDGQCEMTFHLLGMGDDRPSDHGVFLGWTEAFEELDQTLARA